LLKLLLVEGLVEVNQSIVIFEIPMVLDVVNLINDVIDVLVLTEVLDLNKEVFDLLLLNLELSILDIKIEDSPDVCWFNLWTQQGLSILDDLRYIQQVTPEKVESLLDLLLDVFDLLSLVRVLRCF